MSANGKHDTYLLMLGAVLLLMQSGCNDTATRQTAINESQDNGSLIKITTGVGWSDLRVGMPEDALLRWKKPTKVETERKRGKELRDFYYDKDGMIVRCLDSKVLSIQLYFTSKERQRFNGETKKGIGRESSVRDVICTYGDPTAISNTVESEFGENPGTSTIDLDYYEEGISFEFYDHELSNFYVYEPTSVRDPVLWGDVGDTDELRKMNCDNWKKPVRENTKP